MSGEAAVNYPESGGVTKMKNKLTYAEKYGPAMTITAQDEAERYFMELVEHSMMMFGINREEAEAAERSNLGYYAGYYDDETRERVERLYRCAHPVFGKISEDGAPTPEEAFAAGVRLAQEF